MKLISTLVFIGLLGGVDAIEHKHHHHHHHNKPNNNRNVQTLMKSGLGSPNSQFFNTPNLDTLEGDDDPSTRHWAIAWP